MLVYAQDGFPIEIGKPLNKGAEGHVHLVTSNPARAVKLYRDEEYASSKREKIQAMVSIADKPGFAEGDVAKHTAWPLGLVFSDPEAKHFIGFGMKAAKSSLTMADMFAYPPSPETKKVSMVDRTYFLWRLCTLFESVHKLGHIIGDPNDDNIGMHVGRPFLFDVDSIQLSTRGKTFRCPCVHPLYRAPELGCVKSPWTFETYPGETFTEYTDRYALAVLIFRTLFNGAHPFACVQRPGERRPQLSIAQRAAAGETPFFKRVTGFKAPAYAPTAKDFPPEICEMFRRAFVDGATDPHARPSAREWETPLVLLFSKALEENCEHNSAHARWVDGECPYCKANKRFEQATRTAVRHGQFREAFRTARPERRRAQPPALRHPGNNRTRTRMRKRNGAREVAARLAGSPLRIRRNPRK